MDLTCALAAGATCLSDVEAMTAQEALFAQWWRVGFHAAAGVGRVRRPARSRQVAGASAVPGDGAGAGRGLGGDRGPRRTAGRGRRVEYSIGWPVNERTMAGIEQLRERDWSAALDTDGALDPQAQVADLTGLLRHGPSRRPFPTAAGISRAWAIVAPG